jgi:hypothetical protein
MKARHVHVRKAYNLPGHPESWNLLAHRWWQSEWTILKVFTNREEAFTAAALLKTRPFTKDEKDLMKGAQ